MKKEMDSDLIEQGKTMVVEYYNRYIRQMMSRYPRFYKKKITAEDVKLVDHSFADNIEEVNLCVEGDESLIYRILRDMETKEVTSYTIKRKTED